MPKTAQLVQVPEDQLSRIKGLGKLKKCSTKFPKRAKSARQIRSELKKWQKSVPMPKLPRVRDSKIKGVRLKSQHVTKLRRIRESEAATAEMVAQKMRPDDLLGVTYSTLTTYQYYTMKAEYKKRLRRTRSRAGRKKLEQQWGVIVKSAQKSFSAAGVKRVTPKDLDNFARELRRSKANFNAVVDMVNTSRVEKTVASSRVAAATGAIVPDAGIGINPVVATIPAAVDICKYPITGTHTHHFSKSHTFSYRIKVWCPTWTNPWRWCWRTIYLGTATVRCSFNVGYEISCYGAKVWGRGYTRICFNNICASCEVVVTGNHGLGHRLVGNSCIYTVGILCYVLCKVVGIPVFFFPFSFPLAIVGPCPK